jgi:hypothetical protein
MIIRSSESKFLSEAVLQRMRSLPINVYFIDEPGSAHPVPYSQSVVAAIHEFIVGSEKIRKEKNHPESSALSLAKKLPYEQAFG